MHSWSNNCTIIHDVVWLKAGTYPLHQWVRASALAFNFKCPLISSMSSSSCLRPLLGLPLLSIFPSVTCFRRQFLRRMLPTQLAYLHFIVYRIFLPSLTLCTSNTSSFLTRSFQLISILLQHHIPKFSRCFWSTFRNVQLPAPAYNIKIDSKISCRHIL